MNNRNPALQCMVASSMKQIRRPNRYPRSRRFDRRKRGMVVYDIVRKQNFLPPAAPHIQRGKIIERARGSRAGKQPGVRAIPKWMHVRTRRCGSHAFLFGLGSLRFVLRTTSSDKFKEQVKIQERKINYGACCDRDDFQVEEFRRFPLAVKYSGNSGRTEGGPYRPLPFWRPCPLGRLHTTSPRRILRSQPE